MSNAEQALALAAKGFRVFPIKAGAKFPPLWKDWPSRSTTMVDTGEWPEGCNVGIHCDGLLVLDIDILKGGNESLAYLEMVEGLTDTYTVSTPTGGRHLYYRLPHGESAVQNSVGRVGNGIDVRSAGGYVVAPGSVTAAGRYAIDRDIAIADAPAWLIERCGTPRARDAAADGNVSDAAEALLHRARAWLLTAPRSVEGAGGDQVAYEVACALRDLGVSPSQAADLLAVWNEDCVPPWTPEELGVKVSNAYKYAQNAPGGKAAVDDDFSTYAVQPKPAPKERGRVIRLDEFAAQEVDAQDELVEGLLQRASYAALIGQPGEGKSFLMFDLGYAVAANKPWMGRQVDGGLVVYIPFEGLRGLVKRAKALRQKHGNGKVPFYILPGVGINLREPAGRIDLGASLAELPAKPALIVVDTFAKALAGADENSAQDVGAFNNAIEALIESTGACVVVIHHSGKDKSKGARGSSALLGALDTELEVVGGQLASSKQRDIEQGEPIPFKLVPVIVGMNAKKGEIMSCVVEPSMQEQLKSLPRINGNARSGFEVLCDMAPDNKPVHEQVWRNKCRSEFLHDKARWSQSFFDLKRKLIQTGYIQMDEQGMITRRMT